MTPSLKNLISIFENEESLDDFLLKRRSFTSPSRFEGDELPMQLKFCILDIPQQRQITASLVLIYYWLFKEVEISVSAIEKKIADQMDTASSISDRVTYAMKHLQVLNEFYFKVKHLRLGSFRRVGDDMWLKGIFEIIAEADSQSIATLFDEHYITFSNVDHGTYTSVYCLAIIKRLRKAQDSIVDVIQEQAGIKITGKSDNFGFRKIDFEPEYIAQLIQRPVSPKLIIIHQSLIHGLTEALIHEFTNITKDELTLLLKGSSINKKAIIKGGPTRFIDVFWLIFEKNESLKLKLIESKKSQVQRWLIAHFEYEDENNIVQPFSSGTINNNLKTSQRLCKNPIVSVNNFIENFTLIDS
ncbi:MAG: hypothetical protein JST49_00980 [Bacteroidetes bacterium]|nr:hypothetical protein [Bacteroidota bacterium]